jgi:hypothetical protein
VRLTRRALLKASLPELLPKQPWPEDLKPPEGACCRPPGMIDA